MIFYFGADHRGYKLKNHLFRFLSERGYEVEDLGNANYDEADDYPDFASAVARKVSLNFENARGILLCGSGVGVDVVANKFNNVRSSLVITTDQAFDARNDDDANILSLPADYLDNEKAEKILITWIETQFSGKERHRRRIRKIRDIERETTKPTEQRSQ